ncbi:MAG: metalloregulator ArsR/SmtB family transcription factor [Rhodospirillum sp.]|nr:metalloregulator ArsR/SmtB family transcription factor [Rhodospirillum sp.]MCF8490863.1 metalloregulator ArsR/SmtB family transcription factor [Rhodospirillum sp.]MCF8500099.1 metalloregulator ArsR/SmtB family transcription factor [Rhodospirillum sp.]
MNNIASGSAIAEIAALLGDPARANMVAALMGGQALTAGELAEIAGVTAQTCSGHLAKLRGAGLLAVEKQGRHRYHRIASEEIAQAVEALTVIAAGGPPRYRPPGPRDQALRMARTCYDHMAGRLAVALADSFQARTLVVLTDGAAMVTEAGKGMMVALGVSFADPNGSRRTACRVCLDWSERRHHLAGRLGADLLRWSLERGWVTRVGGGRTLAFTRAGEQGFKDVFRVGRDVQGTLTYLDGGLSPPGGEAQVGLPSSPG